MDTPAFDLLIRAGRMFCPAGRYDGPGAVAVSGGRIAASGPAVEGPARQVLDFPDGLLLPGLVDLHAHPARGGSKFGIDPDEHLLPQGVTTVLSQGDAGADDWRDYRERVVRASRTRVRMALNLSRAGESGPGGCFERLEDADADACARAVREEGEGVWGIAVNTSSACCGGNDPDEILSRGLAAAEWTGLPLLFGSRKAPDRPLGGQLKRLRAGDVVTYCFHGLPEGLVRDGRVRDEVWAARERGVLFDVGHGMESFSFAVAEAAVAQGFWPDTISSDHYRRHVGVAPPHHLARVLSKLIAVGLPEAEAFRRVTARPAEVLGLAGEVGALSAGGCADLVLLRHDPEGGVLRDPEGAERPGGCWTPALVVRAGTVVALKRGGA